MQYHNIVLFIGRHAYITSSLATYDVISMCVLGDVGIV